MKTKYRLFLSTVFCILASCQAQKTSINSVFEYEANTRGFFQKIVVKDQTISVSNDRNAVTMPAATKIPSKDWQILVSELKKIKLNNIKNLVAPSDLRHTDAAAMAYLKITDNKTEYRSPEFDNGNPPAEIANLTNKITALAKKLVPKK